MGDPSLSSYGGNPGGPRVFYCVGSSGAFPDSSRARPGARGDAAGCPVLGTVRVAWLCPALPLNWHWVSVSHLTSGISIPVSRNGHGPGALEWIK